MGTASRQIALYPGSFDPITNGHIDIINRGLSVFNEIIVLVAKSSKKKPLFTAEERQQLIQHCFESKQQVRVEIYDGLVVEYAKRHDISAVLRGLRGVSDFDYEFQMATMNRRMHPSLNSFFLTASEENFFINSSLVKEVVGHGGDISNLVPPIVETELRKKLC